jgi:hypothetical protein
MSRLNVNISTSLLSWLDLPKKVIARVHHVYTQDAETITRSSAQDDFLIERHFTKEFEQDPLTSTSLPNSLSFLTSSYAVGLFVTVCLNTSYPNLYLILFCFRLCC